MATSFGGTADMDVYHDSFDDYNAFLTEQILPVLGDLFDTDGTPEDWNKQIHDGYLTLYVDHHARARFDAEAFYDDNAVYHGDDVGLMSIRFDTHEEFYAAVSAYSERLAS